MIQRLQSIYFSIVILLSLVLIRGSFINFSDGTGATIKITLNGIVRDRIGQIPEMIDRLLPLSVLIILIPSIALITIFIFKNRKLQLLFSLFLVILAAIFLIASIYISFRIVSKFDATLIPGFKMILPLTILIFAILAFRGIKKDDQLVKSYDRLR